MLKINKKNKVNYFKLILIFIIIIIFINILKILKIYIEPYYNLKFTNYNYKYPSIDQKFIINTEPNDAYVPTFLVNILKLAFYDREILIDNNQSPNFIIRCENVNKYTEKEKYNAPYISLSGERWTLKRHKYRKNAPPLAEIVSTFPKKRSQLYFPFMVWYGLEPKRIYPLNDNTYYHKKFLVYIASNCVGKRDKLFALIKKLGFKYNLSVNALGICSNPEKSRFPGGYVNLDKIYSKYNFGFAMENNQVDGYITEKIINVFRGGAIPIYWGDSATVNKYFNSKAFINVANFKSLEEVAKYIINLSEDEIKEMQNQPIFINNTMPEIFDIIYNPTHPLLQLAAKFIRDEYFKQINYNS